MKCPRCRVDNPDGAQFCVRCFNPVSAAQPPPPLPPPPPPPPPAGPVADHWSAPPAVDPWASGAGEPVTEPVPDPQPVILVGPPVPPPPVAPRQQRRLWPYLLAGVALVLLLAGGYWQSHRTASAQPTTNPTSAGGSPTPSQVPSPTASASPTSAPPDVDERAQLQAIEDLLTSSAASRTQLHQANQQLSRPCGDVAAAERSLADVVAQRQRQVATAGQLDVSQLPQGEQLRSLLVAMLTGSLHADQAYHQAALDIEAGGCAAGAGGLKRGDNLSAVEAQPSKQAFFQLWSPLGAQFGLVPVHSNEDV